MGMSDRARQIVAVTGYFGAGQTLLAEILAARGFAVGFPRQDFDVVVYGEHGRKLLQQYENVEVLRYNEDMLRDSRMAWNQLEARPLGTYYDVRPFIQMFPPQQDVLLVDPRLAFLNPTWNRFVTHWCYCCREPKATAIELVTRFGRNVDHWQHQHAIYTQQTFALASAACRVQHAELQQNPQNVYQQLRRHGIAI